MTQNTIQHTIYIDTNLDYTIGLEAQATGVSKDKLILAYLENGFSLSGNQIIEKPKLTQEQLDAAQARRKAALSAAFGMWKDRPPTNPWGDDIEWIRVSSQYPEIGNIAMRYADGTILAGRYDGKHQDITFLEFIQLPD